MKFPVPRTTAAATELLTRHAEVEAAIGAAEAERQANIAAVNAAADIVTEPMATERDAIRAALEPWWKRAGDALTGGKRKSIELGGCKVGTRTQAEKLVFALGDDKAALAAVTDSPLRASVTEIRRVLDKKAIVALLKGKTKARTVIEALGFKLAGGDETFFVGRIDSAEAKVSASRSGS